MVTDHAPLQCFFKQQDVNKCQIQWFQEFINTAILIVYQPSKQSAVTDVLSCSPILHDCMDKNADSQPPRYWLEAALSPLQQIAY